jgi:hypothetical protein
MSDADFREMHPPHTRLLDTGRLLGYRLVVCESSVGPTVSDHQAHPALDASPSTNAIARVSYLPKVLALLIVAMLLAGCWGGPDVKPLEIVTVEPSAGTPFGTVGPPSGTLPRIDTVSQTGLSIFFSQYEDDSNIPADVLDAYLTDPELMAIQEAMVSDLLARVQTGEAPLTPEEFYQLALSRTNDPGTALILCHNVLKAMARGRSPIPWEKVSEDPLVYSFNGEQIDASGMPLNPEASPTGSRGQPSLFYRFFSPTALGQHDEGDWYHYFLEAAVAYYGATGRGDVDPPGPGLAYYNIVGRAVDDTMNQMRDGAYEDTPAYRGWRWANALSFLEEAYYGTDYGGTQEEAGREARDHMRGAMFGLSLAGQNATWPWLIPRIGTATATGVDVSSSTYETVDPATAP